jgi:hypothetical protein
VRERPCIKPSCSCSVAVSRTHGAQIWTLVVQMPRWSEAYLPCCCMPDSCCLCAFFSMRVQAGTWRLIYSSGFNGGSLGGSRCAVPAALCQGTLTIQQQPKHMLNGWGVPISTVNVLSREVDCGSLTETVTVTHPVCWVPLQAWPPSCVCAHHLGPSVPGH